ncbi:hypothetical protein VHEMI00803 [[Torrubiella] hemipterigena]|uniref:AA1-like domain-containing protein n=1 Tax=[Torrubiella] hemipterigena TaxID=1531966 RepID=A0A0A1T3K5_9HYPO|nr:hypothetical protein VHEMI00803 [[Torrubiella] hemipterigena]
MQFLVASALLAGAAVAMPTHVQVASAVKAIADANPDSCTAQSLRTSEWTLKDFDFHASYTFTTPAHQNSWGYVNFELANKNLDYNAKCSATSGWLDSFFYGLINYNCTQPDGSLSQGSFNFSRGDNTLNINQTWPCKEEGSRFYAQGGAKLPLDCTEEKWQNPDWQLGQIYSTRVITCKNVTMPLPFTSLAAIA